MRSNCEMDVPTRHRSSRWPGPSRSAFASTIAAAIAATALAAAMPDHSEAAGGITITNLGRAMSNPILAVDGRRAAFGVSEFGEQEDLNGDGDTSDVMLSTYDAANGAIEDHDLAITHLYGSRGLALHGDSVLAISSEAAAEVDHNGDGDMLDIALMHVDFVTGEQKYLVDGVTGVRQNAGFAAVTRSESALGSDQNGDGDTSDQVLSVVLVPSGKVISLGRAVTSVSVVATTPDSVVFQVSESQDGQDLTNDGDTNDQVPFLYDVEGETTTNSKLEGSLVLGARNHQGRLPGPLVPFSTREALHGDDLNGDGDMVDTIPHLFDTRDYEVHRLALPGTLSVPNASTIPLLASEPDHGKDIDGDGDATDAVFAFARFPSGDIWATDLARPSFLMQGWATDPLGHAIGEVSESASGAQDLNGDGDTTDILITRFDPASERTDTFDVPSACAQHFATTFVSGQRALACTVESAYGGDLNGDGDSTDTVALGLNMANGSVRSSGMAIDLGLAPHQIGDIAYIIASELRQGKDLNKDGDLADQLVYRFDTRTGALASSTIHPTSVLGGIGWQAGTHETFASAVEGASQRDYNGDGDTNDHVLHRIR